jgi:hypothetical protein
VVIVPPKKSSKKDDEPNRATLVQILRELNKSAEGATHPEDNGLELGELTGRLEEFWAVRQKAVKVPVLLGALLQNKMVEHLDNKVYSWVRQRDVRDRYRITTHGKNFLRENIESNQRIA